MNAGSLLEWKGILLSALATVSLTLGAGATHAQPKGAKGPPTVSIKYHAIDASTPAGAEALYSRITDAAKEVCVRLKTDVLIRQPVWFNCYSQAVTNAVVAAHNPHLSAVHKKRRGGLDPRE